MQEISTVFSLFAVCGELNIEHGDVCYTQKGWLFAAKWTAFVTCHSGYDMVGPSNQTCAYKVFWAWMSPILQPKCVPGNKFVLFVSAVIWRFLVYIAFEIR